jgi:hypothetical protein
MCIIFNSSNSNTFYHLLLSFTLVNKHCFNIYIHLKALKYHSTCTMYILIMFTCIITTNQAKYTKVCTAYTRTNNEALHVTSKLVSCRLLQKQSLSLHKSTSKKGAMDPTEHELHTGSAKNGLYTSQLTYTSSHTSPLVESLPKYR